MANIIISRTANLDRPGNTEFLSGTLFADENLAHTFAISATRNGAEIALSGVVTACFIRPDGGTVELTGTIEDGKACVTLAESCYVVTGRFKLTIFVSVDGAKTAVYCAAGNVVETTTNTIIDPGSVVPSVDDIIAEYGTMQQAVEDCEDAAEAANTAADAAAEAANEAAASVAQYSGALQDVSDNQIIETTEAAAFAYIPDAAKAVAKGVDITIAPVQAGSGDPSPTNIRPISGWTEVKLGRTGKNMLPKMVAGTYTERGVTVTVDANGVATLSGTAASTGNGPIVPLAEEFVIPKAGLIYCLNNSAATAGITPTIERASGGGAALTWSTTPANRQITLGADNVGVSCARIRFYVTNGTVASGTYAPAIMAEADDYEPNDGENSLVTIALPEEAGTVYGGTLHINEDGSGILTVDKINVTVDGDTVKATARVQTATVSRFGIPYPSNKKGYYRGSNTYVLCDKLLPSASAVINQSDNTPAGYYCYPHINQLFVTLPGNQTIAECNAWLAENTPTIVYELATPTTYTLTAEQVALLKGANTIYADAGDTAVEYVADTKAYIDNKIAELQALILENI